VNEDELLDTLLPAGFSPLVLENMDVSQQRLYFSGADVVVSPHGAGLANIVFGNPRVIECVCPSYTNPCAWLLGVVAGCDYRFHVGNKANREDIMVKPAFVKEMLDGLPLPTQHH
jgi:capsular polysaccharide biosynthesis protein